MHLLIPEYTFATDSAPTSDVVGYLAFIGADIRSFHSGRIILWLYKDFATAQLVPYKPAQEVIEVNLGEVFSRQPLVTMPTILEIDQLAHQLAADHPELTPMQLLGMAVYQGLLTHPRLSNASLVP